MTIKRYWINQYNVKMSYLDELIGVTPNLWLSNDKYFVTLDECRVILSNGDNVLIPKGYRFDGSSVPRFLRNLFPTYGAFLFAALIHDYLYYIDYKCEELGVLKAQCFADKEMLHWSNILNTHSWLAKWDNYLRYRAVRLFGKSVYKK